MVSMLGTLVYIQRRYIINYRRRWYGAVVF